MAERVKPFLKWAGGKTRSAAQLANLSPPFTGAYFEPFMGSAALFFELAPERALLSDANEDLVICFQEVARDPHVVMDLLDRMPNTRTFYLATRSIDTLSLSAMERAARVIYLNKTGFRGLWRVNRRGEFNVPYGEYSRPYYNRDTLLRASKALAAAEVRCATSATPSRARLRATGPTSTPRTFLIVRGETSSGTPRSSSTTKTNAGLPDW